MIEISNRDVSKSAMPRIDTALFIFLNLLLFALVSFFYNLHVIFKHISSPLTSDIVACLAVISIAFLWSFAFLPLLNTAAHRGIKKNISVAVKMVSVRVNLINIRIEALFLVPSSFSERRFHFVSMTSSGLPFSFSITISGRTCMRGL